MAQKPPYREERIDSFDLSSLNERDDFYSDALTREFNVDETSDAPAFLNFHHGSGSLGSRTHSFSDANVNYSLGNDRGSFSIPNSEQDSGDYNVSTSDSFDSSAMMLLEAQKSASRLEKAVEAASKWNPALLADSTDGKASHLLLARYHAQMFLYSLYVSMGLIIPDEGDAIDAASPSAESNQQNNGSNDNQLTTSGEVKEKIPEARASCEFTMLNLNYDDQVPYDFMKPNLSPATAKGKNAKSKKASAPPLAKQKYENSSFRVNPSLSKSHQPLPQLQAQPHKQGGQFRPIAAVSGDANFTFFFKSERPKKGMVRGKKDNLTVMMKPRHPKQRKQRTTKPPSRGNSGTAQ